MTLFRGNLVPALKAKRYTSHMSHGGTRSGSAGWEVMMWVGRCTYIGLYGRVRYRTGTQP